MSTLAQSCAAYLAALERARRAEAAEGRTFSAWFSDRTPIRAGTARKARSRANALDMKRIEAEQPIWDAMNDQPWDETPAGHAAMLADPERFARVITNTEESSHA